MNGPFSTEREARAAALAIIAPEPGWSILRRPQCRDLLEYACGAAGVDLGEYDLRIIEWLAGFEDSACSAVAAMIERAHAAGLAKRQDAALGTCSQCGSPITGYADPYDGQTPRWRHSRLPDPVAEFLDAEHSPEPRQDGAQHAPEPTNPITQGDQA